MLQSLKYILIGVILIVLITFAMLINRQSTSNEKSTSQVEALLESSMLGYVRAEGRDGGISKKEFVANLVDSVIKSQNTNNSVVIFYSFLDKDGKPTTEEKDINSVQFKTNIILPNDYVDLKGKLGADFDKKRDVTVKEQQYKFQESKFSETKPYIVKAGVDSRTQNIIDEASIGISIKRISLNSIAYREDLEAENLTYKGYAGIYDTPDEQEIVIDSLYNPKEILSVELTNGSTGNISYTFNKSSGKVTIKVANGKPTVSYNGTMGSSSDQKELELSIDDPNVDSAGNYRDSEGYTGKLEKVLVSGSNILSNFKYISSYGQANYSDEEGYKGTLVKDTQPMFGYSIPKLTLNVEGTDFKEFEKNNFYGTLTLYNAFDRYDEYDGRKYVKNQASANYNKDGYKGTLSPTFYYNSEEKAQSGEIKQDVKEITYLRKFSDTYDIEPILANPISNSLMYSKDGYEGMVYLKSYYFSPKGSVEKNFMTIFTDLVSNVDITKPTGKPTASGKWVARNVYKVTKYTGLKEIKESDEEGDLYDYLPPVYIAENATAKKVIREQTGVISSDYSSIEDFFNSRPDVDPSEYTMSEHYVVKWAWERNKGDMVIEYTGFVEKPKLFYEGYVYKPSKGAKPVYSIRYKGTVVRDAVDTRVFGYSGTAVKEGKDDRKYVWKGTAYTNTVAEKADPDDKDEKYGYSFVIKYKQDLEQSEDDSGEDEDEE